MNKVIFLVLFSASSWFCTTALNLDGDIVFLQPLSHSVAEIKWLADQVESAPMKNNDPNETLQFIKNKSQQARSLIRGEMDASTLGDLASVNPLALRDVIEEFAMLPQAHNAIDCSIHSLNHFLSTIDLLYGGILKFADDSYMPANNIRLFKFMSTYGKQHVNDCLVPMVTGFESQYPRGGETARSEWRFDSMLSGWKSIPDDLELLRRAREFDLRKGHTDDPRIVSSLRQSSGDMDTNKELTVGIFGADLEDTCSGIPETIMNIFSIYNLSRYLTRRDTESLQLSDRFLKMNEYYRICNQLSNPNLREETLDNMSKNFGFLTKGK